MKMHRHTPLLIYLAKTHQTRHLSTRFGRPPPVQHSAYNTIPGWRDSTFAGLVPRPASRGMRQRRERISVRSERRNAFFLDHNSVLLGCLSSGHSLISIRAWLAGLLLALSRAVRMSRVGMIMVAWTIWVLTVVAATICRLSPAGVGLAVRLGGGRGG